MDALGAACVGHLYGLHGMAWPTTGTSAAMCCQVYKEAVRAELADARAAGESAEVGVATQVAALQAEAAAMSQRAAAAEAQVAEVTAEGLRIKQEMQLRLSEVRGGGDEHLRWFS